MTVCSASIISAEAQLVLDPATGACDGTVVAGGTGFPARTAIELALALPMSDQEAGTLAIIETDDTGSFTTTFSFGELGCDTLARARAIGPLDHFTVYVDDPGKPDDLSIYTRTDYALSATELPNNGSGPLPRGHTETLPILALALLASSIMTTVFALRFIKR